MAQRRPTTFIVFAIFNFLCAILFIGCGVCANLSDAAEWQATVNGVRFDAVALKAHMERALPGYTAIKITGIVLGYVLCLGLVFSGIALLFGGLWAKLLALFVYFCAFCHHLALIVYSIFWVFPAVDHFFNQLPPMLVHVGFFTKTAIMLGIAWQGVGCVYYIIAGSVVLFSSIAAPADEDAAPLPRQKSRRRRDDRDDDDDRSFNAGRLVP